MGFNCDSVSIVAPQITMDELEQGQRSARHGLLSYREIVQIVKTPAFQDTLILCRDGKVKANRLLLAARSKYFKDHLAEMTIEQMGPYFTISAPDETVAATKLAVEWIIEGDVEVPLPVRRDFENLMKKWKVDIDFEHCYKIERRSAGEVDKKQGSSLRASVERRNTSSAPSRPLQPPPVKPARRGSDLTSLGPLTSTPIVARLNPAVVPRPPAAAVPQSPMPPTQSSMAPPPKGILKNGNSSAQAGKKGGPVTATDPRSTPVAVKIETRGPVVAKKSVPAPPHGNQPGGTDRSSIVDTPQPSTSNPGPSNPGGVNGHSAVLPYQGSPRVMLRKVAKPAQKRKKKNEPVEVGNGPSSSKIPAKDVRFPHVKKFDKHPECLEEDLVRLEQMIWMGRSVNAPHIKQFVCDVCGFLTGSGTEHDLKFIQAHVRDYHPPAGAPAVPQARGSRSSARSHVCTYCKTAIGHAQALQVHQRDCLLDYAGRKISPEQAAEKRNNNGGGRKKNNKK